MITLRLAIAAVLAAAAVAGSITYFLSPAPPKQVAAGRPLPPTVPNRPDPGNFQRPTTEDRIVAFERAAEAILKNAKADAPPITGRVPLPKPRPPQAP
jgi:hypothetical protein